MNFIKELMGSIEAHGSSDVIMKFLLSSLLTSSLFQISRHLKKFYHMVQHQSSENQCIWVVPTNDLEKKISFFHSIVHVWALCNKMSTLQTQIKKCTFTTQKSDIFHTFSNISLTCETPHIQMYSIHCWKPLCIGKKLFFYQNLLFSRDHHDSQNGTHDVQKQTTT